MLAPDSLGSAESILGRHPLDEIDDTRRNARHPRLRRPRPPTPEQTKPSRCQRRTVSGFTSSSASRHLGSAAASTVISVRSYRRKTGLFTFLAATMSRAERRGRRRAACLFGLETQSAPACSVPGRGVRGRRRRQSRVPSTASTFNERCRGRPSNRARSHPRLPEASASDRRRPGC